MAVSPTAWLGDGVAQRLSGKAPGRHRSRAGAQCVHPLGQNGWSTNHGQTTLGTPARRSATGGVDAAVVDDRGRARQ
jgi:hypothetical protein